MNTVKITHARTLVAAFIALALTGCGGREAPQTRPYPWTAYPAATAPTEATVEILSLPRGCVVEMNGEYLGSTPLKISIPTTPDGRWQGPPGTMHAISVSTPNNRFIETKKWRAGDHVPQRLLFRPPYAQP